MHTKTHINIQEKNVHLVHPCPDIIRPSHLLAGQLEGAQSTTKLVTKAGWELIVWDWGVRNLRFLGLSEDSLVRRVYIRSRVYWGWVVILFPLLEHSDPKPRQFSTQRPCTGLLCVWSLLLWLFGPVCGFISFLSLSGQKNSFVRSCWYLGERIRHCVYWYCCVIVVAAVSRSVSCWPAVSLSQYALQSVEYAFLWLACVQGVTRHTIYLLHWRNNPDMCGEMPQ